MLETDGETPSHLFLVDLEGPFFRHTGTFVWGLSRDLPIDQNNLAQVCLR